MRAAEKLIADNGLEGLTIRQILAEAKQSNASALQYHFGDLKGLIVAIHTERAEETHARRGELLARLLASTDEPTLRQISTLMVRPAFELARSRPDFRNYIKAFGDRLALLESSSVPTMVRSGMGGESGIELGRLLKRALPHLSDAAFRQRMEFAVRLSASAMYSRAREGKTFRGPKADFFVNGLIDALEGLLMAPESGGVDEF